MTTYLTHDNGGCPFKVVIQPGKITVFDNEEDDNEDEIEDEVKRVKQSEILSEILSINSPFQIFVGKSPVCEMTEFSGGIGKEFDGNAILIRPTEALEYIHVGISIEKFKTDSEVLHYVSPVGNNDVPYTYAITANKIYLLSEDVVISTTGMDSKLLDSFIKGRQDPYTFYYGHETIATFPSESETLETETIRERSW